MTKGSVYSVEQNRVKSLSKLNVEVMKMSARNGDKSRYQINRKRAVHRRVKIRQLVKAVRSGPAQSAKAAK
jgi:hypothetical protein